MGRSLLAIVVASAALATLPATVRADETAETLRLAVGGGANVTLTENPSTGYRWRLDDAASNHLDLIEISDAGYVQGNGDGAHQQMVGVPGRHSYRIVARQPGTAVVVFDYVREWEKLPPANRHSVTVEIGAR